MASANTGEDTGPHRVRLSGGGELPNGGGVREGGASGSGQRQTRTG